MDFIVVTAVIAAILMISRAANNPFVAPISLFTISLALFAFGSLNLLNVGIYIVTGGLFILLALQLIKAKKLAKTLPSWSNFFSPGISISLAGVSLSYIFTRALQFHSWDEFSHWGFVSKATYLFDSLTPLNPAQIQFRSYPPSVTLFEYFISKLGFAWTEANVFWAYQILIIVMIYPFIAKIRWKNKLQVVLALVASILTPLVFFNTYTEIYIDAILGLTFGFAIALIYVSKANTWATSLQLAVTLSFLILIKDSGAFFAALGFSFYLIRVIQAQRAEATRKGLWHGLAMAAIPAASTLLSYLSWSWLLAANKVEKIFNQPLDLSKVLTSDSADPAHWNAVRTAFSSAISNVPLNGFMTLTLCFVVLVSAVFVFEKIASASLMKKYSYSPGLLVIIGGVIYAVGLLALYLFRFGEYEATRLASYSRYLGTYWAGVVFAITALAIWLMGEKPSFELTSRSANRKINKATVFASGWVLLLAIMVGASPTASSIATAATDSQSVRAPLEPLIQKAHQAGVTKGSKVWIISQYSNGFEYWILRYGLLEAQVNDGSWSLGTKNGDQDVWTAAKTAVEWQQELTTYDYVVFYNVTQQFFDEFNSVFVNPAELNVNTVFKVQHGPSGARLVLAK